MFLYVLCSLAREYFLFFSFSLIKYLSSTEEMLTNEKKRNQGDTDPATLTRPRKDVN